MRIDDFLDENQWEITEHEETREENRMDKDEWIDYEDEILIEQFCEENDIDLDTINQSAMSLYDENEEFKRFCNRKYYDYKDEHEYNGYLNNFDVSDSTYDSTYKIDLENYIYEHKEEIKQDFKEYIEELKIDYDEYKEENPDDDISFKDWLDNEGYIRDYNEWFEDEKKDDIEDEFRDSRYSDDYFPIWRIAWQFPTGYTAEELNEMGINGLVFFDINRNYVNDTFVSLTGCGMDMSPSIYCAYLLYSSLNIDDETIKEMLCKVQRKGLEYMGYVMGKKNLDKFLDVVGKEMAIRMDKRGREEYKKFDEQLKQLTKARDKGNMDKATTGLLGMMSYFETQKCRVDEELGN